MLPLPMSFNLPIPKFTRLPQGALIAGAMGYIYGKVADVPALTCAKLFAIMHLANSILFLAINTGLDFSNRNDKKLTLAFTTSLTQMIGIIAMRHFNLIATEGTIVWGLFALVVCVRQLSQAWDGEKFLDLKSIM